MAGGAAKGWRSGESVFQPDNEFCEDDGSSLGILQSARSLRRVRHSLALL
jgi:hypothetical protein